MISILKTKQMDTANINLITSSLKSGNIAVLPTDTIYGMHVSALNPLAVESIYRIRKRDSRKPLIIIISKIDDLKLFDIIITEEIKNFLTKIWPNPVSVILPCSSKRFRYLHRGTNSLAFRIPKDDLLIKIIKKSGPLISTSVNLEGDPPTETIEEGIKTFGEKIDFYIDKGRIKSSPSTVIEITNNNFKVVREGVKKIKLPKFN